MIDTVFSDEFGATVWRDGKEFIHIFGNRILEMRDHSDKQHGMGEEKGYLNTWNGFQ